MIEGHVGQMAIRHKLLPDSADRQQSFDGDQDHRLNINQLGLLQCCVAVDIMEWDLVVISTLKLWCLNQTICGSVSVMNGSI